MSALTGARRRLEARFGPLNRIETYSPLFWYPSYYVIHGARLLLARWHSAGKENIPASGALIVISNHLNNTDPMFLNAAFHHKRRIRFMAKHELFTGPFGWIAPFWGAFPVRRFDADVGALLQAERILRRGGVIGMFPEGTRSRSHVFQRPHPGTALIALHTGATLLPCAITGTERIRGWRWFFQRIPITADIGRPIPVEAVRRPSEAQVSELTREIYEAIRSLLPPAYAGSYTESEGMVPQGHGEDPASK